MIQQSLTFAALELPDLDEVEELDRADLVFYDVDHSGPSFVARVFVNNDGADADTPRVLEEGYAGYFTVFGHNGCYGDPGHCEPDSRHSDEFDRRLPHPLRPWTKTVIATEAVRRAVADPETRELRVTVVAVVPQDEVAQAVDQPLKASLVRLLCYQG